ncbi:MAG: BatD family protein [Victivallales bacterium]
MNKTISHFNNTVHALSGRAASLLVLSFLLFFSLQVFSAGDINMTIAPQPAMVGEPVQLQLVSSEDYPEVTEFPKVEGISWHQGVSKSMQTSIINFKRASTYIAVYEFVPGKEGELKLPALKIQCGKKKTLTDPVAFKVMTRKYTVSSNDGKTEKKNAGLDEILFAKCSLLTDRKSIYVGEEISFEIKVFGVRGLNFDIRSWPEISMENVAFHDFSPTNPQNAHFASAQTSNEKLNGQIFNVYTFRSAFRPIAAGKMSGKVNIACIVKIPNDNRRGNRSSDPFEDMFASPFANYRQAEQNLTCAFPELEALSLPAPAGTVNYLGLIGNWKIRTEISQENLKTGEPATLKISGSGDGTLDTLKAPEFRLDGFRVYPPEIKKSPSSTTDSFEVRYVMIPLQEGSTEINLPVSYFSTASGKYAEVPFSRKMKIEKSDNPQAPVVSDSGSPVPVPTFMDKKANGKKINDILYLKKNLSGQVVLPLWKNHVILVLLLSILGPALWGFSEFSHFRRLRLENDPALRRKIKAISGKNNLLREIRKSDPGKLNALIQNKVVPYLNDLKGLPPGTSAGELAGKIDDNELASLLKAGADSAYMPGAHGSNKSELRSSLLASLKKFSMLLVLFVLPLALPAETETARQFNPLTAYNHGEFIKVAEFYRKQLDMTAPDPALLYNLGNCLYQLGEPAKALVMYERALHLSPRDSDIRENLNLVHRKFMLPEIGDIESPKDLVTFARDLLRPDEWMFIAAIVWAFAGIILALRRRFASEARFYTSISAAGIVFVLLLIAPISQSASSYSPKTAYAVIKNMQVYLLPSETSKQTDFRINCGEKLFIEEERDNWLRVRTGNGSEGWIKADAAERLMR